MVYNFSLTDPPFFAFSSPLPYPKLTLTKVLCPLSNSENVEKIEDILVDDIKRLYLRNLNINLESGKPSRGLAFGE